MKSVKVIDSHTGGEPTRVVIEGGPSFGTGSVKDQLELFRNQYDSWRSAVVNEPRGSDVLVGAWLCPPKEKDCVTGVIFFNNVGYLGMCGHGLIGVIATLEYVGKLLPGRHRIETSVGVVEAELKPDHSVVLRNVVSFRQASKVSIDVPGIGSVTGDVAWGGNWFFLADPLDLSLQHSEVEKLTDVSWRIRKAVNEQGYPEVDHVELFGLGQSGGDSRNFVLCPGKAYDRSPCGTGTSAKLACLAAEGKLAENQRWIQESVIGSHFVGWYHWSDRAQGRIIPFIEGRAFVNSEATLLFNENDPFCWGIRG